MWSNASFRKNAMEFILFFVMMILFCIGMLAK